MKSKCISFGNKEISKDLGSLTVEFNDPYKSFPIRDVQTGEIIPDMFGTYGQIYTLLYGAYWDAALTRDSNE